MRQLLAEKAALTPSLVLGVPGSPFPWYQVPYTHGIMGPNRSYAGGAVTTDELGMRHVEANGMRVGFREFQALPGPKRLLLGASTAFSMGTTSNRASIASQLWRLTGEPWFQLATAAYVSTQELFLYGLMDPNGVTEVVVLSGINTIMASMMYRRTQMLDVFSPNFFLMPGPQVGMARKAAAVIRRAAGGVFRSALRRDPVSRVAPEQLELALATMRRDLGLLRALTATRGIRLTFVAQSLLPLLAKPLSPEEQRILAIQEELARYEAFTYWALHFTELPRVYPTYCRAIGRICEELDIDYYDLNQERSAFAVEEWLFVDQIHLTDQGCGVCAELIARRCAQHRPDAAMAA